VRPLNRARVSALAAAPAINARRGDDRRPIPTSTTRRGVHVLDGGSAHIRRLRQLCAVLRSRRANVSIFGSFDHKRLKDDIGLVSQSPRNDRCSRPGTAFGDFLTPPVRRKAWSPIGTAGSLDIRSPFERAADVATAGTQGGFESNTAWPGARLSWAPAPYGALGQSRQAPDTTEDATHGAWCRPAYPEGEAYGDEGAATVGNPARPRPLTGSHRLQASASHRLGRGECGSESRFTASNHERRSGAGAGLVWQRPTWIIRTIWAPPERRPEGPSHCRDRPSRSCSCSDG
jgi:hypothetical protein